MDIWQPTEETERRLLSARRFTMSDLKPEVTLLTKGQLDYATFVYVADKVTKTGTCKEHETEYYLAHQILRFFLGDEWTDKCIFDTAPGNTRYYRKGRAFLRSDSQGVNENVMHQDRVIKLAECLFNLQRIPGIAERTVLMEKSSLVSVYSEFECARIMSHPSLQLRFVTPKGSTQSDYDAEITTTANRSMCCEIKAKEETSELTQKAIENSIETARKQLPKDQPALVWIRIPEQWASRAGAKAIVDAAVESALRKSDRLVAILVAFQLWQSDGDGMLTQFRYTEALNKKSKFYDSDVKEAMELFGSYQNDKWLSLRDFVLSRSAEFVSFVESKLSNSL